MEAACKSWEHVLVSLESGDWESLVSKLDWVLKKRLFGDYINGEAPLSQHQLDAWTLFLKRAELITSFKCLRRNMNCLTFDLVMDELNADFFGITAIKEVLKVIKKPELTYADYLSFSDVRDRLWEYDMRIGEVRSIYHELECEGTVDRDPVTEAEILKAQTKPPPWGRAKIRGDWIREHGTSARMAIADWTFIRADDRYLDLRDVFETEERWTTKRSVPDKNTILRRRLRPAFLRGDE